jgi:hypothetical protein
MKAPYCKTHHFTKRQNSQENLNFNFKGKLNFKRSNTSIICRLLRKPHTVRHTPLRQKNNRKNFMFYVNWNFTFILFLNEIYNLSLTVKIITQTKRKFINHRSGSISLNNPVSSDIFIAIDNESFHWCYYTVSQATVVNPALSHASIIQQEMGNSLARLHLNVLISHADNTFDWWVSSKKICQNILLVSILSATLRHFPVLITSLIRILIDGIIPNYYHF